MTLRVTALVACMLAGLPTFAGAEIYVFGHFCSDCSSYAEPPPESTRLYDDGLHGDGAAGDGLYGADIVVDQPAGRYTWYIDYGYYGDGYPRCWCSSPPVYLALWTTGPGDVIHFVVDSRPKSGGWEGCGIACDHGMPPGTQIEVGVRDELTAWYGHFPAQKQGSVWQCVVNLPTAGHWYYYGFGSSMVGFGLVYNGWCGCFGHENPEPMVQTTQPNSDVLFQFDEMNGLVRAIEGGITPAQRTTWGALKQLYR